MSTQLAIVQRSWRAAVPLPDLPLSVRLATAADLPFIDALQKRHAKMVGWMPTKQLEGKIAAGQVLVAEEREEDRHEGTEARRHEGVEQKGEEISGETASALDPSLPPSPLRASVPSCLRASPHASAHASPIGYLIFSDRYFKRDDVGIVYQLNVVPGRQRSLVGATLLKAAFERAAYGCRLFCCWCAQDLEANRFWEAAGFIPLAFRTGSREKERIHIFWQRRIRAGDETTPWWFPSQTGSGSIREDRLVLPIPPGTHWSDAKPMVLPGAGEEQRPEDSEQRPEGGDQRAEAGGEKASPRRRPRAVLRAELRADLRAPAPACRSLGGLQIGAAIGAASPAKRNRASERARKMKNDPRLVAAARELRDRWLEQVNETAGSALPAPQPKYDLSRRPSDHPTALPVAEIRPVKLLPAA